MYLELGIEYSPQSCCCTHFQSKSQFLQKKSFVKICCTLPKTLVVQFCIHQIIFLQILLCHRDLNFAFLNKVFFVDLLVHFKSQTYHSSHDEVYMQHYVKKKSLLSSVLLFVRIYMPCTKYIFTNISLIFKSVRDYFIRICSDKLQ